MQVIRASIPEPPGVLIAGLQPVIGDVLPAEPESSGFGPLIGGEQPIAAMRGFAVPRALVGWNPYFAQPTAVGPMATANGMVSMVPIGPDLPANPIIDVTQRFLASSLTIDFTGGIMALNVLLPSPSEPVFDRVLSQEQGQAPTSAPTVPRREVRNSGLLKVVTAAITPPEFGRVVVPLRPDQISYTVWQMTGTTVDGAGAVVGSARVVAHQSGWRYVDAGQKIIAETTSDGSGNFSMALRNIDYQLVAYKVGSPDLGGLTRQDVTPLTAQTIYMRNPTAADSGAAGSGYSRARVVNAGGV